jgi:hypothetical protein
MVDMAPHKVTVVMEDTGVRPVQVQALEDTEVTVDMGEATPGEGEAMEATAKPRPEEEGVAEEATEQPIQFSTSYT